MLFELSTSHGDGQCRSARQCPSAFTLQSGWLNLTRMQLEEDWNVIRSRYETIVVGLVDRTRTLFVWRLAGFLSGLYSLAIRIVAYEQSPSVQVTTRLARCQSRFQHDGQQDSQQDVYINPLRVSIPSIIHHPRHQTNSIEQVPKPSPHNEARYRYRCFLRPCPGLCGPRTRGCSEAAWLHL